MSLLQELLNLGLVDIGPDDSRFGKMESAASALSTRFKEEPSLLVPATLIAMDDSVDENDPIFVIVEEMVNAEWKTLRNTHVNRPRELLRSIVIDALEASTTGNPDAAGVVWSTAASPMRHGQTRLGKATPVIEGLIRRAEELSEGEAVIRAGLVAAGAKEAACPEITPLGIEGTIKDDDVLTHVARAVGPQYPQNQALENSNPHWSNAQPAWSFEFTPRMTAALVKGVNLGTGRLAESVGQNIAGHLSALEALLTDRLRDLEQTYDSSRMRLDVLWWSEALYSPSFNASYRDLPLPAAAVATAVDLAKIVPPLAPASVCYVLGETVFRIAKLLDAENCQTIASYLQGIADTKANFGDAIPRAPASNGRVPLIGLVGEASTGCRISPEAVQARAGVDGSYTLSPAEFAMWLFRGLQANRLVEAIR